MKLRVVSSKDEIDSLRPNEKIVHLAFRASNVDFLRLMQKCPRLQVIQLPHSYKKTLSKAIEGFLEMQGVKMLEGDVWGHRKDIDEYFTVPEDVEAKIQSMVGKGMPLEGMVEEIQKTTRLGQDLIKYIAKTKIMA